MAENKLADLSTNFAVKILKLTDGKKKGLYIIHRFAMVYHHGIAVHKPSCDLMRYNTACYDILQ